MVASFATRYPLPLVCFTARRIFFLFFSGVYFTSIDPSNDPTSIFFNNYDDRGFVINIKRLWAKIDWVIEVKVDMNEVETVYESNRDEYLYKCDVYLNNYQYYSIYKNPET